MTTFEFWKDGDVNRTRAHIAPDFSRALGQHFTETGDLFEPCEETTRHFLRYFDDETKEPVIIHVRRKA